MNNTENMNFMELLPAFMRSDETDIALSGAVDKLTEQLAARVKLLTTWNQIDNVSENELDMLAEELHISWYDKAAPVSVKRSLIKDSDMVHAKMGTNWAAMRVIETYFGTGRIVDWFDYDGKPYHFRIETANQSVLKDKEETFLKILDAVKRKSAVLDAIELICDGECHINLFLINYETEVIQTEVKV
ncbi:MAG: phage tail protein I [Bacillus sp. (in: Bacteria)]|nr:phage tail protein I [Bacillus sp. (in: firmicutes)]MCM1427136.1 phage tail protein I [Eubacterium sp.]